MKWMDGGKPLAQGELLETQAIGINQGYKYLLLVNHGTGILKILIAEIEIKRDECSV